MLEGNEMKVLRNIVGKTKIDRIRSQQIRESCGIKPINPSSGKLPYLTLPQ